MSVSSITPVSATTAVGSAPSSTSAAATVSSPVFSSNSSSSFSNLAVSLSEDAGVVATLSGGTAATGISALDLYNNLANALQPPVVGSGGTPVSSGTSGTATAGGTGTAAASIDVNTAWASLIKSNPSLAPLSAQLSEQQAIVDTFA